MPITCAIVEMMKATKAGATCDGAARPGPRPYKFSNELCRRSCPGLGPSGEARHDSGGPDGAPTGEPGHDMAPDSGGGGRCGRWRRRGCGSTAGPGNRPGLAGPALACRPGIRRGATSGAAGCGGWGWQAACESWFLQTGPE